jgi:hypothetical protein
MPAALICITVLALIADSVMKREIFGRTDAWPEARTVAHAGPPRRQRGRGR